MIGGASDFLKWLAAFNIQPGGGGSGGVESVLGTLNQIGSTGGANPQISILANPIIPGTASIRIPTGTTAQRPGSPVGGMFRYSSQLSSFEGYNGSTWTTFAAGGNVTGIESSVAGSLTIFQDTSGKAIGNPLFTPADNSLLGYIGTSGGVVGNILLGDTLAITDGTLDVIGSSSSNILQDGNSFSEDVVIGAIDLFGVSIITNSVTRFSIDNAGLASFENGVTILNDNLVMGDLSAVRFITTSASYAAINGPTTDLLDSYDLYLPSAPPSGFQSFLVSNGSGELSFVNSDDLPYITDGGNSFGSAISIGTSDNFALFLIVNGVSRLSISTTGLIETLNSLQFPNGQGTIYSGSTGTVTITAPLSTVTTYSLKWPTAQGAADTVLRNDGFGQLSWVSNTASGDITQGGNAFGATVVIGATDGFGLNLITNNITQVSVAASGLVTLSNSLTFGNTFGVNFTGSSGAVTITAPNAAVTSYSIRLPAIQGTANSLLVNDGSGSLSWTTDEELGNIRNGGNSFGDDIEIGTVDDFELVLISDNQPMLRLSYANSSITPEVNVVFPNTFGTVYTGSSGTISITAPNSTVTSYVLTLPAAQGGANTVLGNNGSGVLSWVSNTAGGDITQGGNSFGEEIFIGSSDNFPLSLITNATTRLTIDILGRIFAYGDILLASGTGLVLGGASGAVTLSAIVDAIDPYELIFPVNGPASDINFFTCDASGNITFISEEVVGDIRNGGNSFAAPIVIGTVDAFSLSFITDNLTRLSISSSGVISALNNVVFSNTFGTVYTGSSGAITITAPNSAVTSYALTLPAVQGGANTVLGNNGSGVLSWVSNTAGGDITQGGNSFGADVVIGSNDTFDLVFRTNGINVFQIDTVGDVETVGFIRQKGSRGENVLINTTNYLPLPNDDYIFVDTTSGPLTVLLPDASGSGYNGQRYVIKDHVGTATVNPITVSPVSCMIDGAVSYVISSNYGSITVISDGTNWSII